MKRRRVLFVLGSLGFGGTERQVTEILRHLNRDRFEPTLYLIYRRGELLPQVPADVRVIAYWDRHRPPTINLPGRTLWSQVRDLSHTILAEQIDVVYDRATHMAITAGMATPSTVGRLSTVVADPELDFRNSHPRFRWVKKPLLRRAYERADRVLAVSNGVREELIRFHHLPPQQVVTCYNIFDFASIRQRAAAPGPEFARDRFHVVCVGRLQREKGQMFLLQAVERLVHDRNRIESLLWMIGTGPDEEALRQFVADRKLSQHVRFEGFQSNPLSYVARANVLCLPSLFEGMPNALVEAMACGTPVIASDCRSGPREILEDGRFGQLVPPQNVEALGEALEEAFHHLFNRKQPSMQGTQGTSGTLGNPWLERAQAARHHVEQTYSVAVGMKRIESLLLEVAESKGK